MGEPLAISCRYPVGPTVPGPCGLGLPCPAHGWAGRDLDPGLDAFIGPEPVVHVEDDNGSWGANS